MSGFTFIRSMRFAYFYFSSSSPSLAVASKRLDEAMIGRAK